MVSINVPYNPIPGQGPGDIPTPYRTDTGATPTAFGANIGEAMEGFGKQIGAVGDMLASQVVARQDLMNQAEQDKLDAEFMTRAGQEHERFNALEGEARAKYYDSGEYANRLQAIRDDVRSKASNPMVAKRFDSQSLNTLGRTLFNGAGTAGAAAHEAAVNSAALHTQAVIDEAGLSANPAQADAARKKAYESGALQGYRKGLDAGAQDEMGRKAASAADAKYIKNLNRTDPYGAQKELEKRQSLMTDDDRSDVQSQIDTRRDAVETSQIATEILDKSRDKDGRITISEEEAVAKAKAIGKERGLDDKGIINTGNQTRIQFNQDKTMKYNDAVSNQNVIKGLIVQQGLSSKQEIMANPQGLAAVNYLTTHVPQFDVDSTIVNAVKSRDREYNDHALGEMKIMRDTRNYEFRGIDPFDPKYGLDYDTAVKVVDWQAQDQRTNRGNDPRPTKALSALIPRFGQAMGVAGIIGYNGQKRNDDTYFSFMGDLSNAIDAWQDTHDRKPPTEKDMIETIGPALLSREKYKTWYGGEGKGDEFFKRIGDPDEKWLTRRKQQVPDATDDDLTRAWHREQLMKLFATAPSSRPQSPAETRPVGFADRFGASRPRGVPSTQGD